MKVAVTSVGADLASEVDPRFGRAKCFLVVDTETREFSVHDNKQNLNAVQGAGIQAAQNVVKLGVGAVITGNVGPKAFATLEAGEVKAYVGATGSIDHAVDQFNDGLLECVSEANVEGHWE
jgi:predicted Fe-Mo cluster-binding NifX family protein